MYLILLPQASIDYPAATSEMMFDISNLFSIKHVSRELLTGCNSGSKLNLGEVDIIQYDYAPKLLICSAL